MFTLLEDAGFKRVRSTIVPGFAFRKEATRDAAEAYGVKAALFTAQKPAPYGEGLPLLHHRLARPGRRDRCLARPRGLPRAGPPPRLADPFGHRDPRAWRPPIPRPGVGP